MLKGEEDKMVSKWEKIGLSSWLSVSQKKHRMIIVDKNTGGNWNVILGRAGGARILLKIFKTKTAALKYAKSYMRSH